MTTSTDLAATIETVFANPEQLQRADAQLAVEEVIEALGFVSERQAGLQVVPIAANAADLFYDRLFAIAPEFRALFPQDLRDQKKKLIAMLPTVVASLHQLEKRLPAVQDLGRRHMTYGGTPDHYTPVGEALLWTL